MQEPVYQQKAPPSQYFPKYLSPSVRPLKPDIAATGFRINLTPDVPVSAVAVTLASVVFRLQVSWVWHCHCTVNWHTFVSSACSIFIVWWLQLPRGGSSLKLAAKCSIMKYSLPSHFRIWPSLRSILESLPWPFEECPCMFVETKQNISVLHGQTLRHGKSVTQGTREF